MKSSFPDSSGVKTRSDQSKHIIPVSIIVLLAIVYAMLFSWLHWNFGIHGRSFALIYIFLAAWFWGIRGAVIVGLLNIPYILILAKSINIELPGFPLGPFISISIGAFFGLLRDLSRRLKKQLVERRRAEEKLSRYRNKLEQEVEKRTKELTQTNLQLQREITEREQAEKKIKKSEANLSALIENTRDLIFSFDRNRHLLTFNSSFSKAIKQFGGIDDIRPGMTIEIGFTDPMRLWWAEQYRRSLEGEHFTEEYPSEFSASLSGVFYEVSFYPIVEGGHVLGASCFMRDISDRKVAQEERSKMEAQLQQAQKMEAIGTLAGGIAHDFNNILSAVIGYTEICMMQAQKGSKLQKYLQDIMNAGERAKDLVQQILTFSRQTEKELKPVEPGRIVKEVLKLLRASLPATIDIKPDIKSDALVMADPTQIHQIMMNLCTNAGHAMREKGGVLEVSLENIKLDSDFTASHPDLKPGPYLNLTVTDTGDGIAPEILERIFDPFFTTKGKGEGTGMGLSVVHGIVKSYNGMIYAYSEPGAGSSFKVFLPIIERRTKPEKREGKPISTGTEHILFIDDEQVLVNIGKQLLESFGYKVTTRTSSTEALELFKAQPEAFDLVITDMTMPHMTGDELAKEMIALRPGIPVILCTGFSTRINKERAESMGIRALIMKPVVSRQLTETIRQVLEIGDNPA